MLCVGDRLLTGTGIGDRTTDVQHLFDSPRSGLSRDIAESGTGLTPRLRYYIPPSSIKGGINYSRTQTGQEGAAPSRFGSLSEWRT